MLDKSFVPAEGRKKYDELIKESKAMYDILMSGEDPPPRDHRCFLTLGGGGSGVRGVGSWWAMVAKTLDGPFGRSVLRYIKLQSRSLRIKAQSAAFFKSTRLTHFCSVANPILAVARSFLQVDS